MRPWTGEAAALAKRIGKFVAGGPDDFEALALTIHNYQVQRCKVRRGLTDIEPVKWTDIPAIPVSLFRDLEVGTVAGPIAFRTSGTSTGRRGVHRLRSTRLADLGARAWAKSCLSTWPPTGVALLPSPTAAPDSSLSHLVSILLPNVTWHLVDGRVDVDAIEHRLSVAHGPVFVATTAFALADWLDADPPRLPAGSLLMVTGGFKGRRRDLDQAQLLREAQGVLGPQRIVREYGMTELSSEAWADETGPYRLPPWLRVQARDPWTGEPSLPGEPGQLGFTDLCNLDGSVAIETMDVGTVPDPHTVVLHGRLTGAEPRGCSLRVEERHE